MMLFKYEVIWENYFNAGLGSPELKCEIAEKINPLQSLGNNDIII